LAAIVIGSGIAAQQLSPGDVGLQLTENAIATTFGLFTLIVMFAPLSGAHFNPLVSVVDTMLGYRPWRDSLTYIPAQIIGCILGAILANLMFDQPSVAISSTDRLTGAHFLAEVVATVGLILVIFVLARSGRSRFTPATVAAYIGAAYFFTSSTSFANPAITIGRIFTNTFTGIAPLSALGYIAAQIIGATVGYALIRLLYPNKNHK